MKKYLNMIGGRSVEGSTGEWIEAIDPSRGTPFALVPHGTVDDLNAAVDAARLAFETGPWPKISDADRARLLRRLAELLEKNIKEFIELEVRDNGRSMKETQGGFLPSVAETIYFYAGLADKIHGETIRISPDSLNYTIPEPLGVVGLIIPYNAPLTVLATKLCAALAAGNTAVVKPSEHAACTSLRFAELARDAGFPDGVINVVAGFGHDVGAALVSHPAVPKIALTGSGATAQVVSASAAPHLKQLQFELGGKSPHVIFEDADLAAAVPEAVRGVMTGSAGQSCIAGSRILIQRSIYKEAVEAMLREARTLKIGDPFDMETDLGPLSFAAQFDKVQSFVAKGDVPGAELLMGGKVAAERFADGSPLRGGYFYEPTFFACESNGLQIAREEVFGPVGAFIPFDTEEEALQIANDSDFGLAAGVWSNDIKRALRFVQKVQAGQVWVNCFRRTHWAFPVGGFKKSGYGKDFGVDALKEYQQTKMAYVQLT
ncbi:aldehyde dehydrogenase family protein [Parasphingorhabdus sp.]|uniref:aldehyde dehydrogenase family protein n=1 Tax=Parasphingorhabdus sp. TaxID=2709688 RepID=UPI003A9075CF